MNKRRYKVYRTETEWERDHRTQGMTSRATLTDSRIEHLHDCGVVLAESAEHACTIMAREQEKICEYHAVDLGEGFRTSIVVYEEGS